MKRCFGLEPSFRVIRRLSGEAKYWHAIEHAKIVRDSVAEMYQTAGLT
jgi:hypothetical protein